MTLLEEGIVTLTRFLKKKKIPYMIIGGVANIFWGIPRTTLDIDVTIQIKEENYAGLIRDLNKDKYFIRTKHPLEFIRKNRVLPVETPSGMRVDLIFAGLPYEIRAIRRAKLERVGNEKVCICSPEDLIIHKVISERVQDQEDVRGIIKRLGGKKLDRGYLDPLIRDLAAGLAKPNILSFYLGCFDEHR